MALPAQSSTEILPYYEDDYEILESSPESPACIDHSENLAVNLPPPDEINYTPGPTEYVDVGPTLAAVENRKPVDATRSLSGLWNPVTRYTEQIYAAALERASSPDRPLTIEEEEIAVALLDEPRDVIVAAQELYSSPDRPLTPAQEARSVAVADTVAATRVLKKAPAVAVETIRDDDEDNCPLCDHHQESAVAPADGSLLATNSGGYSESADLSTGVAEDIVENPETPVTVVSQPAEVPLQEGLTTVQANATTDAATQQVTIAEPVSETAVANNSTLQHPGVNGDTRSPSSNSRAVRNSSGGPVVAVPAGSRAAASAPTIQPADTVVGRNRTLIPPANARTVQGTVVVPTGGVVIASEATAPATHPTDRRAESIDGTVVQGSKSEVVLVSSNLPEFRRMERERGNRAPDLTDGTSAPITVATNPNLAHDQSARRKAAQPEAPSIVGVGTSPVVLATSDSAKSDENRRVAQMLDRPLITVAGQGNDNGSGLGRDQSGNGAEQLLALSDLEEPTEVGFELGEEMDPSDFSPSQVYIG